MLEPIFWTREFIFGKISFTPLSLVVGVFLIFVLFILHGILKRFLMRRIFPRFQFKEGLSNAYATLIGYVFLIIGFTFVVPVSIRGINFATFSVIFGAISFGIGFGLRNIADNFVSGLIILIERPIKIGDRITIDDLSGRVHEIKGRSSTIRTNDNIEVIVPNSRFISESVINWSHNDEKVRFRIPVGVHYNSDVNQVRTVLEAAAQQHPYVLSDPAPSAKFIEFGDSSLNFELRVWTQEGTQKPTTLKSDINYLIWDALKEAGIEIPYPQRDLYIKEIPPSMRS